MAVKQTAARVASGLTPKQEEFAQLFVESDTNFFGNGVACYIQAYKPEQTGNWYNVARASASQLLSNINVCKRINELLESEGFNDENVDKQHLFLLNQYADLKTKLGAIAEYNKLKSRITRKLDITTAGKAFGKYEELTNEQLARIAEGSDKGDSEENTG